MSSLTDIEISDALAFFTLNGLTASYYPDEARIRGGAGLFEVAPNAVGYVTHFSMTHLENSWIVHTKIGQILCDVNRHTLAAAVEFVVRLYQETDQFEDESISIDDTLERLRASNFDVRFESTRMQLGVVQICFGKWHEGECWNGISIGKRGRCFFAIRVCRPSPVRKLVCAGDNLLEVVEFLCTNSGDLKADCN
ncbi:MAG: hypothetical protein H0X30_14020 [Anaerolineae bacterium]|nr:hypothetical protein [Anaerolineae bacterium]